MLDFDIASKRMRELHSTVQSQERAAHIKALAEELEQAAAAVTALISEFKNWKRTTIIDPRPRRSSKEAVAITAEGLTIDGDDGQEVLPWSSFAANTVALDKLFFRRLDREWTEAEKTGIALTLNFSSTISVLDEATGGFMANKDLDEDELIAWLEPFEKAARWAPGTPSIDQNRRATQSLFRSLSLANAGEWGAAESSLRHITKESAGSLLVLLLSDGSPAPAPPDPEETGAESEETSTPTLPPDAPSEADEE
jgi:hypothetical protein